MKLTEHRSDILDAKVRELGFIVGKESEYAAIPLAGSETKLVIIHEGNILKTCRNRKAALTFIKKHSKTK